MLNLLNTYRSFLFGLLIFSYVFSVFQKPIFEALHLISHAPAIIFSQEKIHSIDSHSTVNHTHENLTAFYDSTDEREDVPQPQSEQETKKKTECFDKNSSFLDSNILFSKKQFQINLPVQFVFIKIPNPPPKVV